MLISVIMSDLFKKWLEKNKAENENTLKQLTVKNSASSSQASVEALPSTSRGLPSAQVDPIASTSQGLLSTEADPIPSTSRGLNSPQASQDNSATGHVTDSEIRRNQESAKKVTNPTDLVFENDALKLTIVSAVHKQERKFRLSDHMWHLLIVPKTASKKMPLLTDILNFLFVAFNFMLQQLKKFYNTKDKNIAFMTITQASMLNGLNSG